MMKNMLKKMMVIGVGSMLLMGSSVSANAMFEHPHFDNNRDHRCDCTIYAMEDNERIPIQCDEYMGACEDVNKDHYCDYGCGKKYGEHADTNRDHLCEYCTKPVSDHSGGTATCKDRAFCEVCGEPYGDFDSANHAGGTELRNVLKLLPCIEESYSGDTYCKGCDTQLSTGTFIPATGHKDTDNNHLCDNKIYYGVVEIECREKISECSGGTATCTQQAICTTCGKPYGDIDSDNHVGEMVTRNNKEANCEEDGYSGDIYCESCNNVVETGSELPRLGHIDEDTNHICDRETCGKVLSECTGGEATCKDLAVCEYCGHEYGEKDMNNHVGDTEIRDAKEPTCEEDGYTGDTYCTSCDTKLLDGTVIPALGHIDIPETETVKRIVAPQTGDGTPFAAVVGLLVGSGTILTGGAAIKRRRK